jgi:hypothetical protein
LYRCGAGAVYTVFPVLLNCLKCGIAYIPAAVGAGRFEAPRWMEAPLE